MSEILSRLARPLRSLGRSARSTVLVIGDAGYRILNFSGQAITGSRAWPRDAAGRAGAIAELRRHGDCRLHVLVDSMEQTYRREEIPSASIADKRRIVARRLDIAFPGTGLKRAIRLSPGRKGRGGGQDRYLFAALPDSDEVHEWVGALSTLRRPIDGIGLLPLEIAARAARLNRLTGTAGGRISTQSSPWTLVVGRESTGGIRQIVLENNDLALTRLAATPSGDLSPAMLAAQIQRDIKSTIGYLARLGYQQGAPLTLLVIVDDAVRDELLDQPPPTGDITQVVRTPDEALVMLGVQSASLGQGQPWADPVFASLVAGESLVRPLVTAAMVQRQRVWRTMRGARAVAASVLAGLVIASGWQVALQFRERQAADQLAGKRVALTSTLDQRKRQLEAHTVDIELLGKIMRSHDYLGPMRLDLELAAGRILRSLTEEVRLVEFDWRRVGERDAANARGQANAGNLPPVNGDRPFAASLVLDLSRVPGIERAIAITGEIADRLGREFDSYTPVIVSHAVDILPDQALLGDIDSRSLEQVARNGMQARILLARNGQ